MESGALDWSCGAVLAESLDPYSLPSDVVARVTMECSVRRIATLAEALAMVLPPVPDRSRNTS